MPPKKQSTWQPPRRSGRRTVIEDDELSEETSTAKSNNNATAPELEEAAPDTAVPDKAADVDDNDDDDDVVMQEPDTGGVTTEPASLPQPSASQRPVQRLTSVLPSSSSSGLWRHQAPHSSSPAASEQPRSSALKFKPKASIRRSKEEREAFEKAERERLAARHASDGHSWGRGDVEGTGRGSGGYEGLERRGRGRGTFSHAYGHGHSFGGNRGGGVSTSRRERLDPRVASGPLGGATIKEARKRGIRTENGVEEEVSGEDEKEEGDAVGERGGAATKGKGKGKGKEKVKKEAGVQPEGGAAGTEVDKTGKRKRDLAGAGTGKGKGKGRAKVKKEDDAPTYISSEGEFDSDTAEKINIEAINLVSSEEEEFGEEVTESPVRSTTARGKQSEMENKKAAEAKKINNWMNRPVHVERLEHVERAVGVNTDASSLSSADLRRKAKERKEREGGLFLDEADPELSSGVRRGRRKPKDVEFVRDKRKWKGVYVDEDDDEGRVGGGVRVKSEPREEVATADMPLVLENDDEVPGAEAMEVDDVDVDNAVQESTAAAGARDGPEGARALDKENDTHGGTLTDEEDADYEELDLDMVSEDEKLDDLQLETMANDLDEDESYNLANREPEWKTLLEKYAKLKTAETATASNPKPAPVSSFKGNSEASRDDRYHKTYLVQLPPVIPSLRDIIAKPIAIKREKKPTSELFDPSANPVNAPDPSRSTSKERTAPLPPASIIDHQKTPNALHQPANAADFAAGVAGKLTFYGNGKTIASWGDLRFEVTKERETVGLAQETMIMNYEKVVTKIEDQDRWEDVVSVGEKNEGDEGGKKGYSGGRVWGGFCMLGA